MARPSKYTPATEALVVEALTAGASRRAAAEYAGLDEGTLGRWMRRYAGFAGAVRTAESRVEVRAALVIRQAFEGGDWRAAVAWLERRRPDDWAKTDRVEIISSVRDLARREGWDAAEEALAVAEVERMLRAKRGVS